ncbi:MAG: aerial mycelium formation protein [Actinomycetota bacterium]
MSEPMEGGRRRIDRVLAEGFARELGEVDPEEVRRRRDLARAEREYLSFVRRLLQGRRDILQAERERRRSGGEPAPVVDRLSEILSEGSREPSRGEAPVIAVSVDEVALARRRVERLVADAHLSDLGALSDEELEAALARLEQEERAVSDTRTRVLAVHDTLQDEMKRRYRAELGNATG